MVVSYLHGSFSCCAWAASHFKTNTDSLSPPHLILWWPTNEIVVEEKKRSGEFFGVSRDDEERKKNNKSGRDSAGVYKAMGSSHRSHHSFIARLLLMFLACANHPAEIQYNQRIMFKVDSLDYTAQHFEINLIY